QNYHAFPYMHEEMGAALAAADLVLSRAGASVLGEFPYFELPAILVPYPYAWRYQKVNAETLTKRGAALLIEDHLLADTLFGTVDKLINSSEVLLAMRSAMASLKNPDAAGKIAAQLFEIAGETHDQY
ncbi:MAG: glycosyltransferase, partial [Chloroflexota bacterium]